VKNESKKRGKIVTVLVKLTAFNPRKFCRWGN